MPHFYPVVLPGGKSLAGDSLGFHAYSLRIDNLTNQWLLEETSLAWIPPYSLGVCLRLYGTGVGIILNQAPVGQPQLAPVTGEQAVGVYSDQLRTEVAGTPVRQFSLVQTVSDLTQGAVPASPPVGITRMYAAPDGTIHYILSSGATQQLIDTSTIAANVATQPLGGDLYGTVSNAHIGVAYNDWISAYDSGGTLRTFAGVNSNVSLFYQIASNGVFSFRSLANAQLVNIDNAGNMSIISGTLSVASNLTAATVQSAAWVMAQNGIIYFLSGSNYLSYQSSGNQFSFSGNLFANNVTATGSVAAQNGVLYMWNTGNTYIQFDTSSHNYYFISNGGTVLTIQANGMLNTFNNINAGNTSLGVTWPNGSYITGVSGYVQGSNPALKQSTSVVSDTDCLSLVSDPRVPAQSYLWSEDETARRNLGFMATDLAKIIPNSVIYDNNGEASGYVPQELVTLLWGAVRALAAKVQ